GTRAVRRVSHAALGARGVGSVGVLEEGRVGMTIKGWVKGPIELLKHGLEHLEKGTDFDRRMAMIVIDNSVEVAVKTYLGLPERASGLRLPRKRFEEAAQSFPALLDCLDEVAPGRLVGLDLADLEWYHRLRNQLYHEGNGITVEREHV